MDYKTRKGIIILDIVKCLYILLFLLPWIIQSKTEKHKPIIKRLKDLVFSFTASFNIQTKGILVSYGFNKKIEELILYENIDSVFFIQSLFQQLSGEGDILIKSPYSGLGEYYICYSTESRRATDIIQSKILEKKSE